MGKGIPDSCHYDSCTSEEELRPHLFSITVPARARLGKENPSVLWDRTFRIATSKIKVKEEENFKPAKWPS